jgi:glutamate-1-semialdehyde 2,1-aminomutase
MASRATPERERNIDVAGAYGAAEERYAAANPASLAQFERACESLPGGNTRTGMYYAPYPLAIARGEGAYMWDLDGHKYRDYAGDFSAGLYGHTNEVVHAAVREVLADGVTFGSVSTHEARLATQMCARVPSIERVRFCNSGTEANIMSLVTANAVTGRSKIMVLEGAYHGGTLSFPPGGSPINLPFDFVLAPYNDIAGTNAVFDEHGDSLSAVLVELVQGAGGCIPAEPEYVALLRDRKTRLGALLIFDDVMTSRLGPTGRQGALGITPDMTTLGKYVGGGMTAGAFGGRADIMDRYDPRAKDHFVHNGTFNNNVMTLAGGAAGLEKVFTPEVATALTESGEAFRQRLNALGQKHGLPFQATGFGSLMNVHFINGDIRSHKDLAGRNLTALDLFHLEMIAAGIYITRRGYMALSLALTEDDHDYFIAEADKFLSTYGELIAS